MRVSNESGGPDEGPSGAFAELFRLQSEFQARLAEETLRYLRRLQGVVMPAAPGTFVQPQSGLELHAEGRPGGSAVLALEVENLQRVHCMVTPQLTPLVSAGGVTWFPVAEAGLASRLLPPLAVERVALTVAVPSELPPGEYRGALVLQGFRSGSLPVRLTVGAPTGEPGPAPPPEPQPEPQPTRPEPTEPKPAAPKPAKPRTPGKAKPTGASRTPRGRRSS